MGNCGASQHAVESWADDGEWEEEATSSEEGDRHHHGHASKEEDHASEVTIRITRRQLHELMEKKKQGHGSLVVGSSRRSTQELLADIMNSGEVHHHEEAHWHWKPALQSIPEAGVES